MAVVLLALGASAVWFWYNAGRSAGAVTVKPGGILRQISARGTVEARTSVDLASKLDGRIRRLSVAQGDPVRRDRVVVRLDDDYAQAMVDQAQARWRDAELKASRSRRLYASRSISKAEWDSAEIGLDIARADLKRAEALLNDMHIAAPLDGKVIETYREEGESVKAGVPILTVADVSIVRVRAEIDEDDVGMVALGQSAEITADAYPGRIVTGRVVEIGSRVGPRSIDPGDPSKITDTKILEAKIELPNDPPPDRCEEKSTASPGASEAGRSNGCEPFFKLGMTVDVRIELVKREGVLKIPLRTVERDSDGPFVTVEESGGRKKRRVVLGASDRWDTEVLEGLDENEKVVIP